MEQQGEGDDVRGLLVEKLKEARLDAEWNKLLDGNTSVIGMDGKLLVDLADDIETEEQVETLGLALGFSRAALNRYRETSRQEGRVTSKGTRDMLFDWIQKTDPDKQRTVLAIALHRSQLVKTASKYLPDIKVQIGATKVTAAAPNQMPALSDRLLADIASAIETSEHVECLGRNLGFDRGELTRYQETNRVGGRMTCRGTRDMLYDWRQKVLLSDQRSDLRRALIDAGLVMLADQHLNLDGIEITENFTVGDCRRRLIQHYKTNVCKVQMKPWDKSSIAHVKDVFTVVTMYKKDADGNNFGEREKVTLQGSVDDIFKTKVNGVIPYRIVIFAAAGKGKTTAVAKMAHDWVHQIKGSAFEELPLLFIVKLRYPNRHMSLGDAIIAEYLRKIDGLTPDRLEKFVRSNQELCWVVLDGLDEYSGSLRQNLPLKNSIVAVMKNEDLPECRVVVTSRPHLESDFDQGHLPRIYAKMVIEGFDEKQSKTYIDKFFGHSVKGQSLKSYLHNTDVINELVSTPLLCSMVCYLWQADLLDGIDTQTKLFDSINYFLWHHSQLRKGAFSEEQLRKTLKHLGKIALRGLLDDSNKLIFTPEDFRKAPQVLVKGCELGIISETVLEQACEIPVKQQQTKSQIEFYHKLAQEHVAGKYLGGKGKKYLMTFKLSKLDKVLRLIRKTVNGYENLLRFTAGTDNRICFAVMQAIISNKRVEKNEQFRMLFDCSSESPNIEGKVSSAVRGCIRDGSVALTSPTVYTAIGMLKLPDGFKNEITNVTIERPRLAPPLPSRLSDGLKTLSRLQHLTISHPTKVYALPHVATLSSLKLEGLPSTCNDWKWLQYADNLAQLHVTLLASDDDAESEGPSLHLTDGKITSSKMSEQTLQLLENMPTDSTVNITTAEIMSPTLAPPLQIRLINRLQTLPRLQRLTLCDPPPGPITALPHITSISYLRLEGLPSTCYDWEWLQDASNLKELQVTLLASDDDAESEGSSLHLTNGKITSSKMSEQTLQLFENMSTESTVNITTAEILGPTLAPPVSTRLMDRLQKLPLLQRLTISDPSPGLIPALSHFTSISYLKLEGLPSMCDDWEWLQGAGNLNELHVTLLGSDDGSRKSSLHLSDKKITSSGMTEQTLKTFENLSKDISLKIQHLCLVHTHISVDLTHRLWSCLAAFSSLSDLTIEHSSLTFSPRAPTLPSIRSLTVTDISADSYRGMVRSLPRLDWISPMDMDHGIRLDLLEDVGTLYRLHLYGGHAAERRVSSETMCKLCEAVRGITSLREVELWYLVIDEEDLVRLMEACRSVRAMELIYFADCGSQPGGRLDAHVKRVMHPPGRKDGMKVGLFYDNDYKSTCTDYVPHLQ